MSAVEDSPVLVVYSFLPYAESLGENIKDLSDWGSNHRKYINGK